MVVARGTSAAPAAMQIAGRAEIARLQLELAQLRNDVVSSEQRQAEMKSQMETLQTQYESQLLVCLLLLSVNRQSDCVLHEADDRFARSDEVVDALRRRRSLIFV